MLLFGILALLFAAAAGLLYLRLQGAEAKVEKLTAALTTAQTELSRMQMEAVTATPAPTPLPVATPEPPVEALTGPETDAEPTAEPEATPEPTPEAPAQPKDTTDEMLAGAARPADANWLNEEQTAYANSFMVAAHWGPGFGWTENLVLYQNDKVAVLAQENGWSLIRTANEKYGWVVSTLLTDKAPA